MKRNKFDITIIGAGRVGLPLALSFESRGLSVAIKDINLKILISIKKKKSPFKEKGMQDLLKKSKIVCFKDKYPISNYYIITVGTPLKQNIETDLNQITKVIDGLINSKNISSNTIILRSTIAPNTMRFISNYINQKTGLVCGKNYFLSYCPERIVEGDAIKELTNLPQIIGINDKKTWFKSKKLFEYLLPKNKILKGTWAEAELSKLFSNIYRYVNFAIPNYFLMIANHFNVEPFALFDLMNFEYDRNKGLKSPGLTAGTCLRKDYGMINENFPQTDLILQAHKINEFMPMFIINLLKPEKITNKRIGILGYVFKKDTDDTRDSLSPKIYRYLTKLVPKIINISDYNLLKGFYNDKENQLTFKNLNEKELIKNSDVIIIAVNHSKYPDLLKKINLKKKIIIDPWRVLSKKLINNYVKG
jgi:UDP-N-acetyl-D-mannosaminuronic acid dehydrogenase